MPNQGNVGGAVKRCERRKETLLEWRDVDLESLSWHPRSGFTRGVCADRLWSPVLFAPCVLDPQLLARSPDDSLGETVSCEFSILNAGKPWNVRQIFGV